MPPEVVILGSNGFIGSWLLQRFATDTPWPTRGYSSKGCNLLSSSAVETTLRTVTPNAVVIMASSITRLRENSFQSLINNVTMAHNLAEVVAKHGAKHLVFLSTVDVYGGLESQEVITETLIPAPSDYYSMSKLLSEYIIQHCCQEVGVPLLTLRLSGVYGPGDTGKSTISKLVESATKRGSFQIFGDGQDLRDFCYVDDVYRIILAAIVAGTTTTLNVASGQSYSVSEIVQKLKSFWPRNILVEYKSRDGSEKKRAQSMVYDLARLKRTFPKLQLTDLDTGLALYMSVRQAPPPSD